MSARPWLTEISAAYEQASADGADPAMFMKGGETGGSGGGGGGGGRDSNGSGGGDGSRRDGSGLNVVPCSAVGVPLRVEVLEVGGVPLAALKRVVAAAAAATAATERGDSWRDTFEGNREGGEVGEGGGEEGGGVEGGRGGGGGDWVQYGQSVSGGISRAANAANWVANRALRSCAPGGAVNWQIERDELKQRNRNQRKLGPRKTVSPHLYDTPFHSQQGEGGHQNNHWTNVRYPPPPPRVCALLRYTEGKRCSDLSLSACSQ